ncbi:TlpA disulfide reductase family protein [Aquimarina sp. RZ0]|uniref:TlpA disulfide reductase family protein n=1 Tax=Aquimarina sp. RZ0 TaxID=2607730 RepID=UPI0011F1EC2B|nr:TlpA disulfide reductase family protein [Aquimarina sp. RZ0]KAA1247050.1 AhpC/TSA family protein [Aquimarina sp. RZ0]
MNLKLSTPLYIILIFCILLASCKNDQKASSVEKAVSKRGVDEYIIYGTIKNMPDSTRIYRNVNNQPVDSTFLIKEKFEFRGSVEEPTNMVFHTRNFQDGYIFSWVENQDITIYAEKGKLQTAKVSAGKAQGEQQELTKRTDSLDKVYRGIQLMYKMQKVNEKNQDSIRQQQELIKETSEKIMKTFIKDFSDSYVSISLLDVYKASWDKKDIAELYANFSDPIKASTKGKLINDYLTLPQKPEIGDTYVDFELPNTDGNQVSISDTKANYTLVDFWASWCAPCRKENPFLVKTYMAYKNKGFEIVGVSLDKKKSNWIQAIDKDQLPWVNLRDPEGEKSRTALIYKIQSIPYNFLIDNKGTIIAENLRGPQLENKLKELFK